MKSLLSLETLANHALAWHLEDAGLNEDNLPARETFNRLKHILPRSMYEELEGFMRNIREGRELREFMVRQAEKEVKYKRSMVAQSFVDELVEERHKNTIKLTVMYVDGWVRKNDLRAMLAKLASFGLVEVPKQDDK